MEPPRRGCFWRSAAIAAGILGAVVLTALIWLYVIDAQAQALRQGAPVPYASPAPEARGGVDQSTRANDEPRPMP